MAASHRIVHLLVIVVLTMTMFIAPAESRALAPRSGVRGGATVQGTGNDQESDGEELKEVVEKLEVTEEVEKLEVTEEVEEEEEPRGRDGTGMADGRPGKKARKKGDRV